MSLIMPAFAAVILIYGLIKRVPVFDTFLEGAREGFLTLWQIAPTILGLLFAVSLLRTGGATEVLCRLLSPVAQAVGFPGTAAPTALRGASPRCWQAPARRPFLPSPCISAVSASGMSVTPCSPRSPPT